MRLGPMTSGARRGLVYLLLLALIIDAAEFYLFARSVNSLTTQQHAQCRFYDDLGVAPITLNPATGKPSLLGVELVSDARVAWHQLGCPGMEQPADPSFTHWAAYYKLPTS
jgi:hypothetical protein